MKILLFVFFMLAISSCKKKHENIYGDVSINGRISDIVSNAPISNALVKMYRVDRKRGLVFYNANSSYDILRTDTTDTFGNYNLNYKANGEYEFEIQATPTDLFHVNAFYTSGQQQMRIETAGVHTQDIKCHRSAVAKIQLNNTLPSDTASFLDLSGYSHITLYNFFKDTTVYIQLIGKPNFTNTIRFNKSNIQIVDYQKIVNPWDTVSFHINY